MPTEGIDGAGNAEPPAPGSSPTILREGDDAGEPLIEALKDPAWTTRHERYLPLAPIGRGGMGEVWRVYDRALGRAVAMKKLPVELIADDKNRRRFLDEMRTTAALQHPGIVAVHDSGELPDGRLWFTMKEVRGVTLRVAIEDLHSGRSERWTLRRVIEAFARACEAVAYAHSREVVHRDLKPENLMVGEFGEVLVMDWGLVKNLRVRGAPREQSVDSTDSLESLDSIDSVDSLDRNRTLPGDVMGTPAYMSPEQAYGHVDRIGPQTDVYSLGAVLYEILSGRPPYAGTVKAVWAAVKEAPPSPLEKLSGERAPIPPELAALCARAMARKPEDRFPDAGVLGAEVRAWLDGAHRRDRAIALVEEARRTTPKLERLRERARALEQQAREVLGSLKSFSPASAKAKGWALEDEAAALRREAALEEVSWMQALQSALNEVPDLAEAHEMLADHHRARLVSAEEERDTDGAVRAEALLRLHDRGKHAAFLGGRAAVTLVTEPAGAEVSLYRYTENERVLVPEYAGELGRTPLREVALNKGSYLLKVRAPGYHEMTYPVFVGRGEHWSGVAPGEKETRCIQMLREGELEADSVYVPAGWFIAGGDSRAAESLPRRRLWCEAMVVQRYPVTNRQYLDFLNDLVASGLSNEAILACPRAGLGMATPNEDALVFLRREDGSFGLPVSDITPAEELEWPVVFVDWRGAARYARWLSARTGKPWRLLNELEWEKAARGVDGRFSPWGDHVDPSFACMLGSRTENTRTPVSSFAVDASPYGVRGMAGNVRDWCANTWKPDGPEVRDGVVLADIAADNDIELRSARGGTWTTSPVFCRLASRFAAPPSNCFGGVGFRLARSSAEEDG